MPASHPSLSVPSVGAVYGLAWPLTLRAIMLHGIVVIDAVLVAVLGEPALAAMGLAAALGGLVLGVLNAFATATQIRLAQAFGAGRPAALKTGHFCGLFINLAIGFLGALILALVGDRILAHFAHTPEIAADAKRYLDVFLLVILAEAVALNLSSHFNACGVARPPLYSYLLSVPVNVAMSVVLIHGLWGAPELGVTGAAVGSAVASFLRVAYLAHRMRRDFGRLWAEPGWMNGGFLPSFRRHLAFAWPIAATFVSATAAASACTLIYASLSVNEFAAMALIMPWVQVAGTLGMSWAQATGIIVAQLLGQDRRGDALDRFLSGAWRAAFIAAGAVSVVYLAVTFAIPPLYPELHPDTRATLMGFLPVLLLLPFPKGSNAICGHTLRAGGETVYVMHIFVWSQWLFRVPATALMVYWFELSAVWVFSLLLLEELVKFPAFHARLFRGAWKEAEVLG